MDSGAPRLARRPAGAALRRAGPRPRQARARPRPGSLGATHRAAAGRRHCPMDTFRGIAFSTLKTLALVVLAAQLILVLLPMAFAAQAPTR